jgi:hypothetical protein
MRRRLISAVATLTIVAGGSSLLSHPAYAAEGMFDCSVTDIVNVIGALCPNGGTASNIQQTAGGCSFDLSCS